MGVLADGMTTSTIRPWGPAKSFPKNFVNSYLYYLRVPVTVSLHGCFVFALVPLLRFYGRHPSLPPLTGVRLVLFLSSQKEK